MNFDSICSAVVCAALLYMLKSPQPPQDSKVSHTDQQERHETIKHDHIKARHPILGIKFEFLYYFTVLSAEIQMVMFILCYVNLSFCRDLWSASVASNILGDCQFAMFALCQLSFCHCLTFIF